MREVTLKQVDLRYTLKWVGRWWRGW